ncbi:MAG: ATP-dependent helicase HrpB [Parvularculaceae bacterium]
MTDALPIDDVLPAIRAALAGENRLVLAAPPGAGKTTRAPLALLDEDWLAGKRMLLLEPRRIAARMAAERMATSLGEKIGGRIGLSTRVDRAVSAATRIEVVTDGLFTRRILADPELAGVGAVLFDEFHERSLNLDLGLALALDVQGALRDDLRLVVMSATLDTARIAAVLGAPVVESDGRLFPVETIYLGRGDQRVEDRMAQAIRRALREQTGSVLAFLPGMGEIRRTMERLEDFGDDVMLAPLYGALSPQAQDAAVRPAPAGKRKVVIATDIAESSLTIDAVNIVIDAGLARIAESDGDGGTTLVTRRAARANVDQRCGRAGRTGPGVCYRLWDEAGTRGLAAEPTPEIASGDLAGLALALAEWGERDAARLTFIDPPANGRLEKARRTLAELGAIDAAGALTAKGRAMAALPMAPQLAAMIAGAGDGADRALAAQIAVLIGERGLGGASADLRDRLNRFTADNSRRAVALRAQARRWGGGDVAASAAEAGRIIASATPSRIARARTGEPGAYLTVGGRALHIDPADALSKSTWLAIADSAGASSGARILAAAPIREEDARRLGGEEIAELADYDAAAGAVKARRVKRVGAIILSETPLPKPSGAAAAGALVAAVERHGLDIIGAAGAIRQTQARLALAREVFGDDKPGSNWPALDDATLLERVNDWLAPLLAVTPSLPALSATDLRRAVLGLIDWDRARALDDAAPLSFTTPAGHSVTIDYLSENAPLVEARVQEFYGASAHPTIASGRMPLVISLLSPARRQIALTRDLPGFWRGGYRDMAKDMRGRYPKHDWPDDPAAARPHEGRTKARL